MKLTIVKDKPEYQRHSCNNEGLGRVFKGASGRFYVVIQKGDRHGWAILKKGSDYVGKGCLKIHPANTLDHVRPYGLLIFDWGE